VFELFQQRWHIGKRHNMIAKTLLVMRSKIDQLISAH